MAKPAHLTSREQRRNAVIYQIYPRSFQDTNGDGIGDVAGITSRLDYIKSLGVDGIWLSPIYPSPMADMGYDVSNYEDVDSVYGTVEDVDKLVEHAHNRDLAVLLDIVPCHTSIEHPWFREHPDWYVWADGDAPPNNWASVFGGPAWSRDEQTGRWYLHNFYREQPQLNWRNPEVPKAIAASMKFWLDRGVDGFRMDALQFLFIDDELRDEPLRTDPMLNAASHPDWRRLDHIHTTDLDDIIPALKQLNDTLPAPFLIAEVYNFVPQLVPYTNAVDLTFCFSLIGVNPNASEIYEALKAADGVDGLAWSMSNHDLPRLATRWGHDYAVLAAMLLMSLPGAALIYQGDEIGMTDGPGIDPPFDRAGRDACRHPMQWTPSGGFTTGSPWLPMTNAERVNVAAQETDNSSVLNFYRSILRARRSFDGPLTVEEPQDDVLVLRRGNHIVAMNFGESDATGPDVEQILVSTPTAGSPQRLRARSGYIGLV
jgi:alpha-glucosidase